MRGEGLTSWSGDQLVLERTSSNLAPKLMVDKAERKVSPGSYVKRTKLTLFLRTRRQTLVSNPQYRTQSQAGVYLCPGRSEIHRIRD